MFCGMGVVMVKEIIFRRLEPMLVPVLDAKDPTASQVQLELSQHLSECLVSIDRWKRVMNTC